MLSKKSKNRYVWKVEGYPKEGKSTRGSITTSSKEKEKEKPVDEKTTDAEEASEGRVEIDAV